MIGLGALVAGPRGMKALGMPISGRAAWGVRMFGVRELVLSLGLARAATSGSQGEAVLMADLVTAAQAGDMILAAALVVRRELTLRAALVVWAGALPTFQLTRAARNRPRS
ncbi:MAG: hypothetical protein M3Z13_08355 [Candidatus Dormibacteraeota bacterium]|nr:hypothetical protein [Candidatus Dormibacteraeota bacterium]